MYSTDKTLPHAAGRILFEATQYSFQNLRGGVGHATDPAGPRVRGVEARSSGKHAGQVAALYH
jgi:hypothetical protein